MVIGRKFINAIGEKLFLKYYINFIETGGVKNVKIDENLSFIIDEI
jgi:hypothetical protein